MATDAGQRVKLTFDLRRFESNLSLMRKEASAEVDRVVVSGASAYITSISKHTPPSLGKASIDAVYYTDGIWYDRSSRSRSHGLRRVYDLLQLARNPDTGHYRSHYGRLLRQGFFYVVSIYRKGKPRQIPCKTFADAQRYAHETYRGLMRAAWGLNFSSLSGKIPPTIRSLIQKRPELTRMSSLNVISLDKGSHTVLITNALVDAGDKFFSSADTNATIAALRTMSERMEKYFMKKKEV